MEWIEVAKTIAELGIMIVCSALVVTIFWLNYKRSNNKDDKKDDKIDDIMNKIQEQNDMLVNQIIKGVTGHTLSSEENTVLTQVELQINDCLKRVQQKTNASRVSLVRYHNGNKGMDGLSFLKMSMTNLMICLFLCYSVLSATTGSLFAATLEGISPAMTVSPMLISTRITAADAGSTAFIE